MDPPDHDDPIPLPPTPVIDFLPAAEEVFSEISWTVAIDTTIDTLAGTIGDTLPPMGVAIKMAMQRDGTSSVAILRVKSLSVAANMTLTATGTRPLFILADDVTIEGTIDVGAHGMTPGPGGAMRGMGTGVGVESRSDIDGNRRGSSGGGGGSFGSEGAAGGSVAMASSGAGETYAIGTAFVAGSSGGGAGICTNPPGAGGGALLIYAKNSILINGAIRAGGGGGAGGVASCGSRLGAGSGGGSGGAIWLQTPNLSGTGILAANGGGGGSGSSHSPSSINGNTGNDGKTIVGEVAAGGTAPPAVDDASAGGSGAIEGTPPSVVPTLDRNGDSNGGGGGGGLGRIVYRAPGLGSLRSSPTAVSAPNK